MFCSHILLKGYRKGLNCGKKIYKNKLYCRNHYKKYENYEKEEKIDENELKYEKCNICHNKLFKPQVELECDCKYHLSCYLAICIKSDKCLSCSDKIFKIEDDYEECTICLENVILRDKKHTITKCNHHFHKECLKDWKKIKNNCPCCRTKL
jgi:hypothetical protein